MNLFFTCPSSCVYPGIYSWEGICPMLNLIILISYFIITIIIMRFIYLWSNLVIQYMGFRLKGEKE